MHRSSLLVLCLFLTACTTDTAPKMVSCEGTLLRDGQPLEVANREIGLGMVKLEFIPIDAQGDAPQKFGATVDKVGKFSIPGGMLPGKYKIAIRQWDPYPSTDKLQGAFAEDKTPLVREIDGKSKIEIDLAKKE